MSENKILITTHLTKSNKLLSMAEYENLSF